MGRVQKGGLKKGRWTKLSGRVGVDKLQSNNSTSLGIKCNFPRTFELMVEDTETKKKFKLEKEPDEQSDILVSHLGWAEAVDQPCQVQ